MARLTELAKGDQGYRRALEMLLPRGPIWRTSSNPSVLGSAADSPNPTLNAVVNFMAAEPKRVHNRFVDLVLEADPRTADELLDEWIEAWGLPAPCGELPTTDDAKRAMLAAKVAAQGGQSRAYFIDVAYAALDPNYRASGLEYVTIVERPYGVPFRVSESAVGDPLNGEGAAHYWTMHLPLAESGSAVAEVIECLIGHWKPAHTVVEFEYDLNP